jgi:Ca-activated chloride channel family protein
LYAVRTRPGASGHVATASVRWLDPDSRAPHEASGQVESGALDGPLWQAGSGLRVAAVAAYFADALRTPAGTGRWDPLPGAPSMSELAAHAEELAYTTRDETVRGLADAVRQADRLLRA